MDDLFLFDGFEKLVKSFRRCRFRRRSRDRRCCNRPGPKTSRGCHSCLKACRNRCRNRPDSPSKEKGRCRSGCGRNRPAKRMMRMKTSRDRHNRLDSRSSVERSSRRNDCRSTTGRKNSKNRSSFRSEGSWNRKKRRGRPAGMSEWRYANAF